MYSVSNSFILVPWQEEKPRNSVNLSSKSTPALSSLFHIISDVNFAFSNAFGPDIVNCPLALYPLK